MFKKREEDPIQKALDEKIMYSFEMINRVSLKDEVQVNLDVQILQLLQLMENLTAYDDEYDKMAAAVAKLIQLRKNISEEHGRLVDSTVKLVELRKKSTVSPETWVNIGANLAGILMLMNHERTHVIASKAFGLIKKIV